MVIVPEKEAKLLGIGYHISVDRGTKESLLKLYWQRIVAVCFMNFFFLEVSLS